MRSALIAIRAYPSVLCAAARSYTAFLRCYLYILRFLAIFVLIWLRPLGTLYHEPDQELTAACLHLSTSAHEYQSSRSLDPASSHYITELYRYEAPCKLNTVICMVRGTSHVPILPPSILKQTAQHTRLVACALRLRPSLSTAIRSST